jgi:chloride channel 7
MAPPLEDHQMEEEEQRPLLTRALHRSATNNTSQVAMVGSNPCPIESLDYEIIENDLFDQNWRTRSKVDQVRYVVLKWTFCFAIGVLTGIVGFVINLAVENVSGFKHGAVSALMESTRCGNFTAFLISSPTKGGFGFAECDKWSFTLSLQCPRSCFILAKICSTFKFYPGAAIGQPSGCSPAPTWCSCCSRHL